MNAKNFVIDYCSYCEIIEYLGEGSPHIQRSVFFYAFVIEPVHLGNES